MSCNKCHNFGLAKILRCRDCICCPSLCEPCSIAVHENDPFHRVEVWNGDTYLRATPEDLGSKLFLGHGGLRCLRNVGELGDDDDMGRQSDNLLIVDILGIKTYTVFYCVCNDPITPKPTQLLQNGLYPATMNFPRTVFTLRVLRDFHEQTLQCYTTSQAYYAKLRRLTNPIFPGNVPVCA